MALYEHKEFLTFDDLKSYLIDYGVCDVRETQKEKLIKRLMGFIFEKKLTPVYFYDGEFKKIEYTAVWIDDLSNIESNNSRLKRYFKIVGDELLASLFRNPETIHSIGMEHCISYEQSIVFQFKKFMYADWYFDDESGVITAYDIIYPKSDIDRLFNRQSEADSQLSQQIAQLQAENDKLRTELQNLRQHNTPADGEPTDKGQGDSLLILGAAMATMPKLKPNYTQQSHITEILETYKNVSGISQSTLEKKFSQAKRYLKQCIN